MFRHSPLDLILALLGLAGYPVAYWLATADSFAGVIGFGFILSFLICTNFQCVGHNFLHNPFFKQAWLNRVFAVLNSPMLGLPQTLYKHHHFNHHKYNNDRQSDEGETEDFSSIYRYAARPPEPENVLSYAVKGVFRGDYAALMRMARARREDRWVWTEAVFMAAFFASLFAIDARGFVFQFAPFYLGGQMLALAQNYAEHYGASPGDRDRDSVSCYNPVYNFLWFNNGYHQEHHRYPALHWTRVPRARTQLPPETERRVAPITHLAGLFLAVDEPRADA